MVNNLFDKKIGLVVSVNKELAQQLHKSVIKKFKRRKIYLRFNIGQLM